MSDSRLTQNADSERLEYRATWSDPTGGSCATKSSSLAALMRDLDGWMYPKPDLVIEQRTITVGPWVQIDSLEAQS